MTKLRQQQKRIDELSGKLRTDAKQLSLYGWYISSDSDVFSIIKLREYIEKSEIDKVDEIMKQHYTSNLDTILKNLSNLYPDRKEIFLQATSSHKQGMYYASTLLFLSQADGICKGNPFVLRNDKKVCERK